MHRCLDHLLFDRHGQVSAPSTGAKSLDPARLEPGDAASTANLLGGEGIRHAMDSADVLADCLLAEVSLEEYQCRLKERFGWRWGVSTAWHAELVGAQQQKADQRMERLISGLSEQASAEDLSELLFDYRLRYGWRLLPYLS